MDYTETFYVLECEDLAAALPDREPVSMLMYADKCPRCGTTIEIETDDLKLAGNALRRFKSRHEKCRHYQAQTESKN